MNNFIISLRAFLGISLILSLFLWSCGTENNNGYFDADADLHVDDDVATDVDGETDSVTDPDAVDVDVEGDGIGDPDVDLWECGCPDPPLPECQAVERVAFSRWDESLIEQLTGAFACATQSLDIALYDVQWPCLVDAILMAADRNPGLQIRVITDNDNCGDPGELSCDLVRLESEGVAQVIPDNRSYLMHHKVVIVDAGLPDRWALVGSANWTFEGFCEDFNGNVVIDDGAIVDGLSAEFDRMFIDGDFGGTPWEEPITSGGMALYFSPPGDDWQDEIIAEINGLSSGGTFHFMIFAFTRLDMGEAMIAAHERGVAVSGLVSRMFSSEEVVDNMLAAGIDVRKDFVHHKALILDDGSQKTVIMGSGNYSTNARVSNNETVIIFWDDPELYGAYLDEFNSIWAIAEAI